MVQVRISYDPDLAKVGKVVLVEPEQAKRLVAEGRAVAVGVAAKKQTRRAPRAKATPRTTVATSPKKAPAKDNPKA